MPPGHNSGLWRKREQRRKVRERGRARERERAEDEREKRREKQCPGEGERGVGEVGRKRKGEFSICANPLRAAEDT